MTNDRYWFCNAGAHKTRGRIYVLYTLAVFLSAWTTQSQGAELCGDFSPKNRFSQLGGGITTFSEGTYINSIEIMQSEFVKYEADLRTVLAQQGLSNVADALFQAVASGEGISNGSAEPGDSFQWMAYRKKGQPTATAPVCLATSRAYESYEVSVDVEEGDQIVTYLFSVPQICMNLALKDVQVAPIPEVAVVYPAPECSIVAQPSEVGVGEAVTVDVSGSWTDLSVEIQDANGDVTQTLSPPFPQSVVLDTPGAYTLTGMATNAGGDSAQCQTAAINAVRIAQWTLRPFLAGVNPSDDITDRTIDANGGIIEREKTSFSSGWGGGVGLEYHVNDKIGIEGRFMVAATEAHYSLDNADVWEMDSDDMRFAALTFGPNFHFGGNKKVDFFVGPFIGIASFDDAKLVTPSRVINTRFDSEFVWGGQLGADIRFSENSPWKMHAGIMKMFMEAEEKNTGRNVDLDPTAVVIGAAYDF